MDAMATKTISKTKKNGDLAQTAADALASSSKAQGRTRAPATSRGRIQKRRDQVQAVRGSAYVPSLNGGRAACSR